MGYTLLVNQTKEAFLYAGSMGTNKSTAHTAQSKPQHPLMAANRFFCICSTPPPPLTDLKIAHPLFGMERHGVTLWAFQQSHTKYHQPSLSELLWLLCLSLGNVTLTVVFFSCSMESGSLNRMTAAGSKDDDKSSPALPLFGWVWQQHGAPKPHYSPTRFKATPHLLFAARLL